MAGNGIRNCKNEEMKLLDGDVQRGEKKGTFLQRFINTYRYKCCLLNWIILLFCSKDRLLAGNRFTNEIVMKLHDDVAFSRLTTLEDALLKNNGNVKHQTTCNATSTTCQMISSGFKPCFGYYENRMALSNC
uniref:Uncharacterized protein n=1 Tax=Magallana gigas TaxID=29159 RepID=A0A8W8ITU6_MAGGI